MEPWSRAGAAIALGAAALSPGCSSSSHSSGPAAPVYTAIKAPDCIADTAGVLSNLDLLARCTVPALGPAAFAALATKAAPQSTDPSGPDIYRDRRGLKIHANDLDAFAAELERAFDAIAERYYLHLRAAPRITVGRDDIRVRFEVDKED